MLKRILVGGLLIPSRCPLFSGAHCKCLCDANTAMLAAQTPKPHGPLSAHGYKACTSRPQTFKLLLTCTKHACRPTQACDHSPPSNETAHQKVQGGLHMLQVQRSGQSLLIRCCLHLLRMHEPMLNRGTCCATCSVQARLGATLRHTSLVHRRKKLAMP